MLTWAPIRYAHNGDVSIAYTVVGDGSAPDAAAAHDRLQPARPYT